MRGWVAPGVREWVELQEEKVQKCKSCLPKSAPQLPGWSTSWDEGGGKQRNYETLVLRSFSTITSCLGLASPTFNQPSRNVSRILNVLQDGPSPPKTRRGAISRLITGFGGTCGVLVVGISTRSIEWNHSVAEGGQVNGMKNASIRSVHESARAPMAFFFPFLTPQPSTKSVFGC